MDFDHPPSDPIAQFRIWLEQASTLDLPNPNAMTLATADAQGSPAARIVLLKHIDENGAVFYSHRSGRKGRELADNPRAALLFFWDALNRQVRMEGEVSLLSDAESDAYFATRPRESRIGAWASRQSQPVTSRAELEASVKQVAERFANQDVPRPPYWGGYRVALHRIEFWQGHEFRLHDRLLYTRDDAGNWTAQRLFP